MQGGALEVVLSNTYALTDAHQRLGILKEFFEQCFFGAEAGTPSVERLHQFVSLHEYAAEHASYLEPWVKHFSASLTSGTLYQRMNELHDALKAVPVLTLYTPVLLGRDEVDALGPKVRTLVGKPVLLDLHLDANLFAGCAFVWNGVYHNYGLAYLIERKKEAFINLLAQYDRN